MTDQLCHEQTGTGNASVIQVESSKLMPLIVLLALLAGLGFAFALAAGDETRKLEREVRILQNYVNRLDDLMVSEGVTKPGEDYAEYRSKQHKD